MSTPCARTSEIEPWFDGRATRDSARDLEAHLGSCVACAEVFERLETLRAALRSAAGAGPNPFAMRRLRREVLERAAARREATPQGQARVAAFARSMVAVAAFALMGLGLRSLWQPGVAPSGVHLSSSPASRFSEEDAKGRRIVRIVEGTFDFDVRPSADGRRLLVIVPDGEIEDIGTKFRVVVEAGHTMEVSVSEGEVEVRRDGHVPERLLAGMTFRPHGDVSTTASATAPASTHPSSPSSASSGAVSSASTGEVALVPPPSAPQAPRAALARGPDAAVAPSAPPRSAPRSTSERANVHEPPTSEATASPEVRGSDEVDRTEDAAYLGFVRAVRAKRDETARRAGLDYLTRYPAGFRAKEVAAALATFPPTEDDASLPESVPGARP